MTDLTSKTNMYYALDSDCFAKLEAILKALYGDGSHLTPDMRRDLAHKLLEVRNTIKDTEGVTIK